MKVLHTSDIHLKEYGDERWEALSNIIDICNDKEVDVLVIAGDLFDKNPKLNDIRSNLQELFSENNFKILIIPGNHDKEVCSDMYFGGDSVLLDDPFDPFESNGVRFIGLPCEKLDKEKVAERIASLKEVIDEDKQNVLLYHGELLDSFFSVESYGDEEKNRYMPTKICYFDSLKLDYVLAGHFHSNSQIFKLNNGGFFVYPGSPYPITKREIGERKVNLFEIGDDPSFSPVDSKFYDKLKIKLDPFESGDPFEKIEEECGKVEDNAIPLIEISGYINSEKIGLTEKEFVKEVKKLLQENINIKNIEEFLNLSVRDISSILEDDLFKEFIKKLDEKDYPSDHKEGIKTAVIQSMMGASF